MANKREICLLSRRLWEKVFTEDTHKFLDYYDEHVADHNRIYGQEEQGEMVAMLHRNPYRVQVGSKQTHVSYIVAVATKESCRHQGRMRRLLHTALQDARREGEPFVFLMPASESIYKPFGFRTVGWQNILLPGTSPLNLSGATSAAPRKEIPEKIVCRLAVREDIPALSDFSKRVLKRHCGLFTLRDEAYYERIWAQQEAVDGGILLFYLTEKEPVSGKNAPEAIAGERLCGYCFTGTEDGAEAWELVIDDEIEKDPNEAAGAEEDQSIRWQQRYAMAVDAVTNYFASKGPVKISAILPGAKVAGFSGKDITYRPITMIRIVHLPEFMKLLKAREPVQTMMRIKDDFLPENAGTWQLTADQDSTYLKSISPEEIAGGAKDLPQLSIEELTDAIFGIREVQGFPMEKFEPLRNVYLNELV